MKDVEVEIPVDLREKIAARLDFHLYEQKQARRAPLLAFWKPLVVGGLAMAVLVGTLMTINSDRNSDGPTAATIFGTTGDTQKGAAKPDFHTLHLDQIGEGERAVTVTNALTGDGIAEFKVQGGDEASIELRNSGDQVGFSKVQIQDDPTILHVAIPSLKGQMSADLQKDATLRGAAMRLSVQYNRPIVLIAKDPGHALSIVKPISEDALAGARSVFGEGYAVDQRADGFIWVQQH